MSGRPPPGHLTPADDRTRGGRAVVHPFEGAGRDGLIAKSPEGSRAGHAGHVQRSSTERTRTACPRGLVPAAQDGEGRRDRLVLLGLDRLRLSGGAWGDGAFPMAMRGATAGPSSPACHDVSTAPWNWREGRPGTRTRAAPSTSRVERRQGPVVSPAAPERCRGPLIPHGGGRASGKKAPAVCRWTRRTARLSCTFEALRGSQSAKLGGNRGPNQLSAAIGATRMADP